ncbi:MAG: hypothetical protein EPN93_20190 [Spirochaetes bacterium]|nr:MAG: hypothetical protein EPN93_20190 [Spirochaetota bacterium]
MSTFMLVFVVTGMIAGLVFLLAGIFNWNSFFKSGTPYYLKKMLGDAGGRAACGILGIFAFAGLLYVLLTQ